jgi:hypothetical protein
VVFTCIAVTTRQTMLFSFWIALLVAAILFFIAVGFGLLFRSSKWWGIAVALAGTDLLLGSVIAWLDRFGTGY